jgi:hypothetical protein
MTMRKQFPLVLCLLLSSASLAVAQQATPAPSPAAPKPAMSKAQSQKIIVSTEKKLWEGWKTKNYKPFRTYLSNDSVNVGDRGVATKTDLLKAFDSMNCEVKSYELSDIKVVFLDSDAALVTYKAAQDGTCEGEALPAAVWASSTYVRRGGKWLAASHQETTAK